ncbi:PP0621 family protein [Variovorax sp. VaC1]|uniref:PP0621 family protein n=1 Tax=Variovorax sp. VaC1 TaxID=3373132 RepID=UPI003749116B
MKYLLVLAVLWVAIWLWRKNRREEMRDAQRERAAKAQRPPGAPAVGPPQAMVRCAHCGLHLPATDAIAGPGGTVYCSVAHRQAGAAPG